MKNSMDVLKCAVIGYGGIGVNHARWLQATGHMELSAVCDVRPETVDAVRHEFLSATVYGRLDKMLADQQLDLAIISTPHHLHAPQTIACLEAGVDVVVEKPMATSYNDCRSMIAAAEGGGGLLTVFHNRRLDPWYIAARGVVESGRLGRIVEIRAMWLNPPFWKSGGWRSVEEMSGGLMFDWGAHLVDYVLGLAASPVVSVAGRLYKRPSTAPHLNDDHGRIDIRFKSGAYGEVEVSDVDREPSYRFIIVGEDATLVDYWDSDRLTIYRGDGRSKFETEVVRYSAKSNSHSEYYVHLVGYYAADEPLLVSAESAAEVVRVLNLAKTSSNQGGEPKS